MKSNRVESIDQSTSNSIPFPKTSESNPNCVHVKQSGDRTNDTNVLLVTEIEKRNIITGRYFSLYNYVHNVDELEIEEIQRRIANIHKPIDVTILILGIASLTANIFQSVVCDETPNQFGGYLASIVLVVLGIVNFITVGAFTFMIVMGRIFAYVTILFIMILQVIFGSINLRRFHNMIFIQKQDNLFKCDHMIFIFISSITILVMAIMALAFAGSGILVSIDEVIQAMKADSSPENEIVRDHELNRGLDDPVI